MRDKNFLIVKSFLSASATALAVVLFPAASASAQTETRPNNDYFNAANSSETFRLSAPPVPVDEVNVNQGRVKSTVVRARIRPAEPPQEPTLPSFDDNVNQETTFDSVEDNDIQQANESVTGWHASALADISFDNPFGEVPDGLVDPTTLNSQAAVFQTHSMQVKLASYEPSGLYHGRLIFDQPCLEIYGHSRKGPVQDARSGLLFLGRATVLPFRPAGHRALQGR